MKQKPELVYQEEKLQSVVDFFAKAFLPPDGKHIRVVDTFVDPAKGKVVYKMIVSDS